MNFSNILSLLRQSLLMIHYEHFFNINIFVCILQAAFKATAVRAYFLFLKSVHTFHWSIDQIASFVCKDVLFVHASKRPDTKTMTRERIEI